jgi:uncharacterized protein YggE
MALALSRTRSMTARLPGYHGYRPTSEMLHMRPAENGPHTRPDRKETRGHCMTRIRRPMVAEDGRGQQPAGAHSATVQVRGEGVIEIEPDAATIVAGMLATAATLERARADAAHIASEIIAAARDAGIPDRDIQTSSFTVTPRRDVDKKGNIGAITSYDIRNRVTLTVRDLDDLPSLLDAVISAGSNDLAGPSFFVQHPEQAEDDARRMAMASARRCAEVLAASAGATLGRVVSIVDGDSRQPSPRPLAMAKFAQADQTPIEAGVERITASVEVTWELN